MKLAYLIAAHNDLHHLKRLVNVLGQDNDFFIHIDKKSDINISDVFFFQKNIFCISNEERIKVYWAGFSQVKATLLLIKKCVETDNVYDKVIFISGSCYPIKSNFYIDSFMKSHKDVNFIKGMNISKYNHPKYNYCLKNYHFFDKFVVNNNITKVIRKSFFYFFYFFKKKNYISLGDKNIDVYHGSSWWALNMDVIKFLAKESESNHALKKYFSYTMASDEKYFHTLFFNSPYRNTNQSGGEDPFIPFTASFANLHIIDKSLTKTFSIVDKELIKNSDKLFVRKVSTEKSTDLLNWIDFNLLNKKNE